jgi:diaminopimelate decarboxylase
VNGVAKHTWLGRVARPDLRVHFDSVREAEGLCDTARARNWRVGLRCHVPAERDGKDERFGGQFGLTGEETVLVSERLRAAGVRVEGLHFHLGTGTRHPHRYRESMEHVAAVCARSGLTPTYIDCGGGIDATGDTEAAIEDLDASIRWAMHHLPFPLMEVWTENGRYLTHSSAVLIVRVLDVKVRSDCRYLICDGGRTNQALDADNVAHPIMTVPERAGRKVMTTIAGPTCMTDDRLARVMLPDTVVPGDLIVWMNAGAYHLPWETRFSHGLCAVVWCDGADAMSLARARETPEQWSCLWNPQS